MPYCTVLDVIRKSGIYNQVINEAVGTGDAQADEFPLENNNLIRNSETIYLDGTAQTRDTNYNINFRTGVITFLSTPGDGVAITATYKYFSDTVDLTNEDIDEFIADADVEINEWTGKIFTESGEVTETFEGRKQKIKATDSVSEGQHYSESFEDKYVLILPNYPVLSVSKIELLDDDGTVDDTLDETEPDYHWWDHGKIQLITTSIPAGPGKKKVKVYYTYGYASVPRLIKSLSAVIAAIMAFVNLTGGSYDEITSYTLGPKSVSVGEPYMNMREAIKRLTERKERLLNQVGREFRTVVI